MSISSVRVLFLVALASAAALPQYTRTPYGYFLSHCVHEVPEGAHLERQADGSHIVTAPEGTTTTIPACNTTRDVPIRLANRPAVGGTPLPPDYDGWLQYTAVNVSKLGKSGGFDAFTNVMSVPDCPESRPDILYIFPGLQNIDWIPKVDPEPTSSNPFDIIQPVLQYPGPLFSKAWIVKSWYVTVNSGAMYSKGLTVHPGDSIFCNMTRTGTQSWSIAATLKSSGKSTTQKATNERLKLQPWAYNTLECYGCQNCKTYPKEAIKFTENKLYQGGEQITVTGSEWEVNPKPAKSQKCHEATTVASNGDTVISFQ